MPIYCYETEDGQVFERIFDCNKIPPSITVDGVKAKRSYKHQAIGVPGRIGWPFTCYASGVNADDASKLRDYLAEKGVPTEVTSDGDPIYTSHAHRSKALRARGLIDKAGYN